MNFVVDLWNDIDYQDFMETKREKIIRLAERIASLRKELSAAEREFNILVPEDEPLAKNKPIVIQKPLKESATLNVEKGSFLPGRLADQIYQRLESEPEQLFKSEDFSNSDYSIQSVRGALARLASAGKIEKVKHGVYRFSKSKGGKNPATISK